ncbi:MAG: GTP 3',8-cyclase MoaA [Gemmatimonadota bacterium]|nr:GTP 3',8-cyclase MoaA [Gemmatimonadota bacterium]
MSLLDAHGRSIVNLRVSVTDRCNLRCAYCLPHENVEWIPRAEILSYEEIVRFVRVVAPLGIRKVRLTGGEPLLRKDLPDLVKRIVSVPGIEDVGMTTNGIGLDRMAEPLLRAGLRRVNVSLDTLDGGVFRELTRRDSLEAVLRGLDAALSVGFRPVKINAVIRRGINDDAILPLAGWAREKGCVLRFIEYMPIGNDRWNADMVVTNAEILRVLSEGVGPLLPVEESAKAGPAARWRYEDGGGEVGLIGSVTEPFCGRCDRIRVTSDGKLRTCLFSTAERDLRELLREGGTDAEIADLVRKAVDRKEPGHRIGQEDFVRPDRTMSAIGG